TKGTPALTSIGSERELLPMRRLTIARRRPPQRAAGLALLVLALAGGAAAEPSTNPTLDLLIRQAERVGRRAAAWYRRTPPSERVTWGGLAACATLGLGVALERMTRL